MKIKLILLLVLLVLFGVFVLVKYFLLNQQNVYGQLKVISSPTASVFINNLAIGKTPFGPEKYKVGEYIIKLIPEGMATDTASWQGKIKVYKNALTYVNRELGSSDITSAGEVFTTTKMESPPKSADYGEISVDTEPNGAIVYLDNDEKGVASLIMSDVLKGDHELSVFMPGFFRRTQKINVDGGYRVNASFKLAIDQSQKVTPTPATGQQVATGSASTSKTYIVVKDTPTGWLRVRDNPSISASESAKVNPKDKFELLDTSDGWYKISYVEGKFGWVSAEYVTKEEQ
jgi:hypothetical protein